MFTNASSGLQSATLHCVNKLLFPLRPPLNHQTSPLGEKIPAGSPLPLHLLFSGRSTMIQGRGGGGASLGQVTAQDPPPALPLTAPRYTRSLGFWEVVVGWLRGLDLRGSTAEPAHYTAVRLGLALFFHRVMFSLVSTFFSGPARTIKSSALLIAHFIRNVLCPRTCLLDRTRPLSWPS